MAGLDKQSIDAIKLDEEVVLSQTKKVIFSAESAHHGSMATNPFLLGFSTTSR